ncbi:hypothetical protein BDY24DRAFT_386882 [Mrakia frigida]|uniref:uncharacterized protein n=1 Tax=Mrakia frigida TaxID=29902 RepID=UPI003FCC271A
MADSGPQIPVAVGIVIGLLSSLVQSLGLTIQRKSHMINESKEEGFKRVEHKRPLWILGFAIFITSNILGTIFQVGALPIVVLAPLGAVSLLWNALFARFMLGDVFTRWMVLGSSRHLSFPSPDLELTSPSFLLTGTILITGGAILIAIFGVVPEPTHSLEDLVRLFGRTHWVVFLSVLGGVVLVVLVTSHIIEYTLSRQQPIQLPLSTPPASPLSSSKPLLPVSSTSSSLSSPPSSACQTKLWLALSFAAVSGTLSGLCLLFAKSGVELLILTVSGHGNQFGSLTVLYGGGGLVVMALAQLYYLNHSLKLSSPTLICPLAFSFYNLSSVFGGLIYFDQFQLLTSLQLGLVCLGIAILLCGVGAVSLVGDSGVDVGVWAEEEVEEEEEEGVDGGGGERVGWLEGVEEEGLLEAGLDSNQPPSVFVDEPTSLSTPTSPRSQHHQQQHPSRPSGPAGRPSLPPLQQPFSNPSSPLHSPNPHYPSSPSSPSSPHKRRSSSSAFRYTSLLPPFAADEPPARAGFSIGLGAASPGFVLRPTNFGQGHGHGASGSGHVRTGSGGNLLGRVREGSGESGDGERRRRSLKGWWKESFGGGAREESGGDGRTEDREGGTEEGRVRLE